jgi:DNA-binding MarR family transcriptional regulator
VKAGAVERVKEQGVAQEKENERDRLEREAFITMFIVGNRFEEQIDACCRAAGISHPQYSVLWVLCLSDLPFGVPMGMLADGLLHRAADATRLVDRLVAAGLVTRTSSASDRRVVLVQPTPEGRATFETVTSGIKALHREQFRALTSEQLSTITHLLNTAFWSETPDTDGGAPPRPPRTTKEKP